MKKLHLPLLIGAACIAFNTQAQDSLQLVNLEEIVISGNKIIERKSDIPHQIDLVLQPQISKIGRCTLEQRGSFCAKITTRRRQSRVAGL
jgi:hypothetical protein